MNKPELAIFNTPKALTVQERSLQRARISKLEDAILKQPQIDPPLKHHFSHGIYGREMFLPKGSLIVGKIHKLKNFNIISQGDVSFFSIDGADRVQAPHSFVGSPGAKRVIYAHEDTVWTTIHGTDETDLDKIEELFIAKDYHEVDCIDEIELKLIEEARKCLGL